jgi:SPP1 family predicted phage head-tail adaptor
MRAGKLRDKIEIHSHTSAVDDFGQSVKTYALLKPVWSEALPISANETETGGKYEGRSIFQFTIRYTTGVSNKNRIVFGGQNYEIFEVLNTEARNVELKIKAVLDE